MLSFGEQIGRACIERHSSGKRLGNYFYWTSLQLAWISAKKGRRHILIKRIHMLLEKSRAISFKCILLTLTLTRHVSFPSLYWSLSTWQPFHPQLLLQLLLRLQRLRLFPRKRLCHGTICCWVQVRTFYTCIGSLHLCWQTHTLLL